MKAVQNYAICGRFMCTSSHLISVALLLWTYKANVKIGLSDETSDTEKNDADNETLVRWLVDLYY
jgi:hypothetical protein